jgi:(E)-4-hydroxy-3-methylbut-2-enyl-diphosphate synthase
VSLSEDPEFEVKPCVALRQVAERAWGHGVAPHEELPAAKERREGQFGRRKCDFPIDVPLNTDGSVLTQMDVKELEELDDLALCKRLGLHMRKDGDIQKDFKSYDAVIINGELTPLAVKKMQPLLNVPMGVLCRPGPNIPSGVTLLHNASEVAAGVEERIGGHALIFDGTESAAVIEKAGRLAAPRFAFFKPETMKGALFMGREVIARMKSIEAMAKLPLMLWFHYPHVNGMDEDDVVVQASADFGSLFVDGIGEGILWEAADLNAEDNREACFNLLQGCRMRISKTEFLSCPSCGRTLFDLQETVARIKAQCGHLPGVRVAVMGCIVNGLGEMADADFGYVGSGTGKIDLYVNYDVVERGVPEDQAVDKLVDLIKSNGRWSEPRSEEDEENELVGAVASVAA